MHKIAGHYDAWSSAFQSASFPGLRCRPTSQTTLKEGVCYVVTDACTVDGREDGAVEVQQSENRIMAVASAQLGAPYPDRPNQGSLSIYTEFSPMADPNFEPGHPGEQAIELGHIVDRGTVGQ